MPMIGNLGFGLTGQSLAELTELMRDRGPMTPAEKDAQARSFIRGQSGASDEELRRSLGPPLAELLAAECAAGRLAGLREAAEVVRPRGKRPCDCTRCDCGNVGDAEEVRAWDEGTANAAAILALAEGGRDAAAQEP